MESSEFCALYVWQVLAYVSESSYLDEWTGIICRYGIYMSYLLAKITGFTRTHWLEDLPLQLAVNLRQQRSVTSPAKERKSVGRQTKWSA